MDFLNLYLQAIKILEDEVQCDIIKIGSLVRNKVQKSILVSGNVSVDTRD